MAMAKKKEPDQYLVQAYQSPYNQQLFPIEDKEAFEKHLRQEARIARDRAATEAAKEQRLQVWTTLRQSATCLEDVPKLLGALDQKLATYYKKRAFFQQAGQTGWELTIKKPATLAAQCITHKSPLGQPTNWGRGKEDQPTYLLGLRATAEENLNYAFDEASRESGIAVTNNELLLFADDWPFVAKMALVGAFGKSLNAPDKFYPSKSTSISPDYTRFWEDINKYSLAHVGMNYDELKGMRDTLGLQVEDLKSMMVSYAAYGIHPPVEPNVELPDGIEDDSMPAPSA